MCIFIKSMAVVRWSWRGSGKAQLHCRRLRRIAIAHRWIRCVHTLIRRSRAAISLLWMRVWSVGIKKCCSFASSMRIRGCVRCVFNNSHLKRKRRSARWIKFNLSILSHFEQRRSWFRIESENYMADIGRQCIRLLSNPMHHSSALEHSTADKKPSYRSWT